MTIKGTDAWVDFLSREEMPVLGNVVNELNALAGDDETEVAELADAILKDANLTSLVLRVANSVQYNPASYPISTISRAIVLVGFSGVRDIAISALVIDSLLGASPRERLLHLMARAFHGAVQASNLCRRMSQETQEEVFIAALLYHLGDMAFWSRGGEQADQLDLCLQEPDVETQVETRKVIGTDFKKLTLGLAKIWNLGGMLEEALHPAEDAAPKIQAVCLGEEISRAAINGWDSPEVAVVVEKVASFAGCKSNDAHRLIKHAADEATTIATAYGAERVTQLIPSTKALAKPKASAHKPIEANPQLQLHILRDMMSSVHEQVDVNVIFGMVVEGMHRGIGLERVVLAIVDNKAGHLRAKSVLGEEREALRKGFCFPLKSAPEENSPTFAGWAVKLQEAQWINEQQRERLQPNFSAQVRQCIGDFPFFIAPIRLNQRVIGVFYADRYDCGAVLDDEHFDSFRYFVQQTELCLSSMVKAR